MSAKKKQLVLMYLNGVHDGLFIVESLWKNKIYDPAYIFWRTFIFTFT